MVRSELLMLTAKVRGLADSIHDISRQMHPAILDDLGLIPAIRSECLAFAQQHGISTEFTSDHVSTTIREDVALCLYRVVQESLRNVAKHAGMSRASVRLRADPRELVLTIEDAGMGIDPDSIRGKRGLGLVSMEERLRSVGGTLSIRSQQGCGTRVEARVPLAP
jgi:signal transduction histidine kinase